MQNKRLQVLVTGAAGFVGSALCGHLLKQGFDVKAVGRAKSFGIQHKHLKYVSADVSDIRVNWSDILKGVDVIVHLAARVHHLKDKGMQALTDYQAINVKGTQRIARAAIKCDVKRFIYVSTIKVNGEMTIDMPLRADDQPRPECAYSLSKLQGEQILQEEARRSGMEWVIIRPPLVYGPGVKGNFRRLLKLSKTNIPLPLSAIRNRRSLVSVYNLCSFMECCLTHPHAEGEVFLVSDNQDISTTHLIRLLKKQWGKRAALFPFPIGILKLLGSLTFKRKEVDRMVDSLQVNIEKSLRLLDWQPPFTVEQSLENLYTEEKAARKM